MPANWSDYLVMIGSQALTEMLIFLPKIIAAVLIFVLGAALANVIRTLIVSVLGKLKISSTVQKTPIEHFLKNADFTHKVEDIVGTIVYWSVMLVVIHTSISILGLTSLSLLLERVVVFIPKIVAAVIILFFGILLAGVIEGLVKGAIRSIDGRSARVLGKVSSYLVVTIAIMAAISELGIAKDFILILFVGFVTTLTIGLGLALGLGAKDLVKNLLDQWYKGFKAETETSIED